MEEYDDREGRVQDVAGGEDVQDKAVLVVAGGCEGVVAGELGADNSSVVGFVHFGEGWRLFWGLEG